MTTLTLTTSQAGMLREQAIGDIAYLGYMLDQSLKASVPDVGSATQLRRQQLECTFALLDRLGWQHDEDAMPERPRTLDLNEPDVSLVLRLADAALGSAGRDIGDACGNDDDLDRDEIRDRLARAQGMFDLLDNIEEV